MKVDKWVAVLATGSMLALTAPVSAQFGGLGALKKKLDTVAKELDKSKSQPPAQTDPEQSGSATPQGGYAKPRPESSAYPIRSQKQIVTPPTQPSPPPSAVSSSGEGHVANSHMRVPNQEWECNTGFPDATLANLKIFDLQQSGERTHGKYEIRDIPEQSGEATNIIIERGSVNIEGKIYAFSPSYYKDKNEDQDSFLLSLNFKIAEEEGEGTPILAEILSPERKEAFQNDEFDGMEQGCGLPGTWSGQ